LVAQPGGVIPNTGVAVPAKLFAIFVELWPIVVAAKDFVQLVLSWVARFTGVMGMLKE
jgi:hypothetical protein